MVRKQLIWISYTVLVVDCCFFFFAAFTPKDIPRIAPVRTTRMSRIGPAIRRDFPMTVVLRIVLNQ